MTTAFASLRVVLVAALGAVVSIAAGDVFDAREWALLIVPAAVGLVGLVLVGRSRLTQAAGAVVAVIGSVIAVAFLAGGDLDDARDAFTAGPQRLLTTEWPSPSRPDLLATVAVGTALLFALATALAKSARLHLSPLLPILVAYSLVVALSAPGGARLGWLLPLGVLAVLFALFRPGVDLGERWNLVRGERQAIPVALSVFALTAGLALPLGFDERADPRRDDDPERTIRLIDPIEATLALQAIDPPEVLHVAELAPGSGAPTRWRTAALTEYDGRRWEPNLELRAIGTRLADDGPTDVSGTLEFARSDLQLVPLPGEPVLVDAEIDTDPDRTIVRLADRPDPGLVVTVRSRPPATTADTAGSAVARRTVDETVTGLTELANTLVVDNSPDGVEPPDLLSRLRVIESSMREDFVLDSEVPGGGLQRGLISIFLRDTRRGTAEQFVTSFVLLARSLSADARVATGFIVDPSSFVVDDDGSLVVDLSSSDAAVWPEVNIGGTWVPFDPVPAEEASDLEPDVVEPPAQTPAQPQPPVPPPPESTEEPEVTDTVEETESDDAIPAVVVVGLRAAAVIGALLVPIALAVLLILGVKWRQRRRRLRGPPNERIRGAWSVATNRLVDAGMSVTAASTNDEIAESGAEIAPTADREIHRLATLASAATFGSPARADLLVDDANSCLGQVETSLGASRTRWQRLRWRLSLRSLRRSTRSPV